MKSNSFYNGQILYISGESTFIEIRLELRPRRICLTVNNGYEQTCELLPGSPIIFTESLLPDSVSNDYGTHKILELIEVIKTKIDL